MKGLLTESSIFSLVIALGMMGVCRYVCMCICIRITDEQLINGYICLSTSCQLESNVLGSSPC